MEALWEIMPAMSVFAFVMAITPGPNNFLLASSGAQFGMKRSIRHLLGIRLGIIVLIGLCASGVGAAMVQHPGLYQALRYLGLGYMLWLAGKLVLSRPANAAASAVGPLSLKQATLFQLGNIKAWMACLALVSSYSLPELYWLSVLMILLVFTTFGLMANSLWAYVGYGMRSLLDSPKKQQGFNVMLALLTVGSLVPAFLD
ncbi:LysE family translocator [Photobacterium atrarenae]|uniref:LysE family translocator n=1 Tax=Photobacterium atrarenae TaxID=865757 RepID=A0ABY5GKC4_9GAMM|nr:LysE family translocator [Photobacterium atrarenae]UTV29596.1 LysE family translocator [Photobacterium atrarenae]